MAADPDPDPFSRRCVHLCIDMQRMFDEDTDWHTPWLRRVLPNVERLVGAGPEATVFTRFVPVSRADDAHGEWARYYRRWPSMTLERLDPGLVDLVPELRRFVPPARVVDKSVYSPWHRSRLDESLRRRGVEVVIVSGGETDVCVLATVLGAIDHGYHVVLAADCLCSSSDEAYDATVTLYLERYSSQVSVSSAEDIVGRWTPEPL
ncbi:cysteine hydrolase family protein [Enterovirga rhinocerotis]|uniref:Nicotinamidase-related amidase n=1 Tax=Enterovirga rhinocerotis TaxID=1339210 RepID=A0A4R7C598_9HYPH|nr:isochorismatase family cysteine hydrolase [Enterovirga rhinocerotis]TDR93341.1 nicotinamidase-related amidase [Enterovirga rhinocerotis]